jgi:hypothetical protein
MSNSFLTKNNQSEQIEPKAASRLQNERNSSQATCVTQAEAQISFVQTEGMSPK